jgi:hypothetical protein
MKVALTGATGFIGSHILTELHEHGHEVTALLRDAAQADIAKARGATPVVIDLYDRPAVTSLLADADGAIHTASPGDATSAGLTLGGAEYLALSDSTIAADPDDGEPLIITDTRPPSRANLAATDPAAAATACTGTIPLPGLRGIALLSDGAARLADRFGLLPWPATLAVIRDGGPGELIRQVRAAEASDPDGTRWPRSKSADDATVLYWHLPD